MRYSAVICVLFILLAGPAIAVGEDGIFVTKKDYPMAVSEGDLDLFNYSMKENHMGLWVKLRQEGRAWLSDAGAAVVIVEKKAPNKVKVRNIKSNIESWTIEDALNKK
jgi:hypothetical protein